MVRFTPILLIVLALACSGTSSREAKAQNEPKITTFNLEAIPDSLSGCSCLFSETKENYASEKYLYFDDIGENAVISVNGKVILLRILKDKGAYSDGEYEVSVINRAKIEEDYESTVYSAEMIFVDRLGNKTSKKLYGICGC